MNSYLRLLKYAKPYIPHMVFSVVCMLILSATTSAIAYLVKPAIDEVFLKKDFRMLVIIPILVVAAYALKGLSDFGQAYFMGYAGNHAVADIRDEVYRHIQRLSLSFFSRVSTGELMARIANDVAMLRRSVSDSVKKLLRNSFLIVGLSGVAFYQNWKLALVCFVLLPWVAIPIVKFGKKGRRYSRRTQERIGYLSTFLDETISGNQTVKAFCMEQYENERFSKETDRLYRISLKNLKISALSSPLMGVCGGFIGAAIIYIGGYQVINSSMTPGEFFSFVAALAMLYRPIKTLSKENIKIQRGMAAAIRVFDLLDIEPEIKDRPDAQVLSGIRKSIEFRNVWFTYEDTPVLKDVSLSVSAGEVLAVVGHSGAGKTTVLNLLLRFYDVSRGGIYIDGINIKEVAVASLRKQFALVSQECILFNDTVRNNIAYGSPDIDDSVIHEAARAAYAHDFIMEMPQGYDTLIGEKGVRLSGGQRQRLSIARALVKNAPILLLDEATSALDTHSEQAVQQALAEVMKGRTTFVIAHRLSTVRNADQIIVLDEGRIIERGTHDDLIKHSGVYNRLVEIQKGYHRQQVYSSPIS